MRTKPPSSSDPSQPPQKRTSLKDLATYLGVSQTTVSFVLNDAPLAKNLTAETRRRVHEAARKFNYRPSYFALNLHKTGSDSVGVLVPEHSEGYFTIVMEGVERFLLQKHFLYFTACHYRKHNLVKEYSELLMNRGAEGLLLLNTNADFDTQLPVVTISGHLEKEGVTNVILDHRAAARLAIRHLYDLGHRKIAFMKGPRSVIDTEFRWEAMMQVAREFGVQPTPERTVQLTVRRLDPAGRLRAHPAPPRRHPRLHRRRLLQRHHRHRRHARPPRSRHARPLRRLRHRLRRHRLRASSTSPASPPSASRSSTWASSPPASCSTASPTPPRNTPPTSRSSPP